ncbi:MAG TPA: hypothetical protein VNC78_04375 [Actinomycetota bacterium]|nr:hypothetical protein [Actinomycetota bacterium]
MKKILAGAVVMLFGVAGCNGGSDVAPRAFETPPPELNELKTEVQELTVETRDAIRNVSGDKLGHDLKELIDAVKKDVADATGNSGAVRRVINSLDKIGDSLDDVLGRDGTISKAQDTSERLVDAVDNVTDSDTVSDALDLTGNLGESLLEIVDEDLAQSLDKTLDRLNTIVERVGAGDQVEQVRLLTESLMNSVDDVLGDSGTIVKAHDLTQRIADGLQKIVDSLIEP